MAWLRLIRWTNLLIIFLTQLLAWCCVIPSVEAHMLPSEQLHPLLTAPNFLLLSLSTVLIAAAGYIINDYFDIKIDAINRPEKVVLEKQIPRRMAILSHTALNIVALLLAGIVARQAGHYEWLLIQLACTIALWFYSTRFKRQFMTGNIIVALLTALTIITLIIYEPMMHAYLSRPAFIDSSIATEMPPLPNPVWVLGVYAFFAFMLTWMREIVKDMEDFKGDAEQGCVTMPIKWGLLRSARFTQLLSVIAIAALSFVSYQLIRSKCLLLGAYTLAAIVVPLLLWTFYLDKKATIPHYHSASRWLKIIMVLGISSLIIYAVQYI